MFTCFDIMFKTPAIDEITQLGITSFVFPTWWVNYPFLTATQVQVAFAKHWNVTLLAANSGASYLSRGSGIYVSSASQARLLAATELTDKGFEALSQYKYTLGQFGDISYFDSSIEPQTAILAVTVDSGQSDVSVDHQSAIGAYPQAHTGTSCGGDYVDCRSGSFPAKNGNPPLLYTLALFEGNSSGSSFSQTNGTLCWANFSAEVLQGSDHKSTV